MKILYVGDNRNRVNWGCRATSKALKTLIFENNIHELTGTIDGKEVDGGFTKINFSRIISVKWFKIIERRSRKYSIFRLLHYIILLFGEEQDFISEDIDKSVAFFEKNHQYFPKLSQINKHLGKCEAIVINGEGDMIFTSPPRRNALFYLMLLSLANKRGKLTFYVNAMISDPPNQKRNESTVMSMLKVFVNCNKITLRDPFSYEILSELDKNRTLKFEYIPDALFTWVKYFKDEKLSVPIIGDSIIPWPENDYYYGKYDFSKPYICISGSSLAAWNQEAATEGYIQLVNKLKELEIQMYLVPTCVGDQFLSKVSRKTDTPIIPVDIPIVAGACILANSLLFVSGRFHPSILASLNGTPCIFMGSNSHKTHSLQKMLGVEIPKEYGAIPNTEDVHNIYLTALSILKTKSKNSRQMIINKVMDLAKQSRQVTDIFDNY